MTRRRISACFAALLVLVGILTWAVWRSSPPGEDLPEPPSPSRGPEGGEHANDDEAPTPPADEDPEDGEAEGQEPITVEEARDRLRLLPPGSFARRERFIHQPVVFIDLTVRDEDGKPVEGMDVLCKATHGAIGLPRRLDEGRTDARGKALVAYVLLGFRDEPHVELHIRDPDRDSPRFLDWIRSWPLEEVWGRYIVAEATLYHADRRPLTIEVTGLEDPEKDADLVSLDLYYEAPEDQRFWEDSERYHWSDIFDLPDVTLRHVGDVWFPPSKGHYFGGVRREREGLRCIVQGLPPRRVAIEASFMGKYKPQKVVLEPGWPPVLVIRAERNPDWEPDPVENLRISLDWRALEGWDCRFHPWLFEGDPDRPAVEPWRWVDLPFMRVVEERYIKKDPHHAPAWRLEKPGRYLVLGYAVSVNADGPLPYYQTECEVTADRLTELTIEGRPENGISIVLVARHPDGTPSTRFSVHPKVPTVDGKGERYWQRMDAWTQVKGAADGRAVLHGLPRGGLIEISDLSLDAGTPGRPVRIELPPVFQEPYPEIPVVVSKVGR